MDQTDQRKETYDWERRLQEQIRHGDKPNPIWPARLYPWDEKDAPEHTELGMGLDQRVL